MKLTIVIPAYNEAATIREIVRRVQATPWEKEIIVVDDGSTDGTRDILASLEASIEQPNLRVLFHERNQGKGGAVQTGFAAATGDFVIVQDADLEYDPRDYETLLGPLISGDADAVFGSRFKGPVVRVNSFWHAVGNKLLTLLSNMTTDLNLSDIEGGLKAYRTDLVRRLRLESRGFEVEPELVAKIARMGSRVYEVPISYHGRTYAEGKKINWRDGFKALKTIAKYGLLPEKAPTSDSLTTSLKTMESLANYNDWLWQQIAPYVGERVLEAGCGPGAITKYLLRAKLVVACDYDRQYVAGLERQYGDQPGFRVRLVDLAAPDWDGLERERFDTIVCMNVLEHLRDDALTLRRFADVLDPGGRLILLVPANRWLYGTIDAAVGHHRRYELPSLSRLLQRSGFEVEQIRYLNPTGVAGWLVNSRILRRREIPAGQAKLYDRLYPLLRRVEELGLPFGLSVLAVGRKPGRAARQRQGASR